MELRPQYLTIENIRGIKNAELNFGKAAPGEGRLITLIGENGKGKTSVLTGLAAVFTGGWDPTLIRTGEDAASADLLLSNGTKIRRSITRKGSYVKITTEEGQPPVKSPETYLKGLASGFGFDPIGFDQAPPKKRLEFLLKVLPLSFTAKEITTAMGPAGALHQAPAGDLDITSVGKLVRELTEKRGGIGSRRDEKASSIEVFRKSLIDSDSGDTPKDWTAEVARLTKERDELDAQERGDIAEIDGQLVQVANGISASKQALNDQIQKVFNNLLSLARAGSNDSLNTAELEKHLNSLRCVVDNGNSAAKEAAEAKEEVYRRNEEARRNLAVEMEKASAGRDGQQRTAGIREQMDKLKSEIKNLNAQWDAIATAIKAIESLKAEKLANLPVEGIEVSPDGDILLNGLPWDSVNQAQRWMKSFEIGAQGLGEMGLMIADAAEHLGPTNWADFEAAVKESGLTVVAARVPSKEQVEKFGPGLRSEPANALVTA